MELWLFDKEAVGDFVMKPQGIYSSKIDNSIHACTTNKALKI